MTSDPHPDWNAVSKIAISVIGSLLAIAVAMAANAADKQAQALERLKEAVYETKRDFAVSDKRLEGVENRVDKLESHVFEGKR